MSIYDDPKEPFKDAASIADRIDAEGAISLAVIDAHRALDLYWSAANLPFALQPETTGRGHVRQQVEISPLSYLSGEHPIATLARRVVADLSRAFDSLERTPFATPFAPNDIVLQRYQPGSIGITPHHDGTSRVNLVCVLMLWGDGEFALCDDRAGTNPRPLFAPPGHLILMKAPGFRGADLGPFHLISRISRGRLILGIRERRFLPR